MFGWFRDHLDDEKDEQFWKDAINAMQLSADYSKVAHGFAVRYGVFLLKEIEKYVELQEM